MRVLTFIHSFEPGGVERIALRLVRQWRADGIDALLYVGRTDGAMRADAGRAIACLTPPLRPWRVAHWETLWMIAALPRVVREQRPDVLFCAGNTYTIVAVALKLLLGPHCPPIVAKISNDLERRDQSPLLRRCYRWWLRVSGRFLDHVIATELPMAAEARRHLDLTADAVTVIPNPALSRTLIDELRRVAARPAARAAGRRFVAVGRLVPQKNLPLLLRAFAAAAAPHDTLALIGDGPERARLEELAQELGLDARVTFGGYQLDPARALPAYDALLLSSDYEGVPAVILEALAANLAIVATNCSSSIAALLDNGRLGTIVPVGDTAAFASAIRAVVPARQDRTRSLAQCRRFQIEDAAPCYVAVMRPLAEGFGVVRRSIEGISFYEDRFA